MKLPDTVIRKLAGEMLDRASVEFGAHGCNDFDLVRDGGLTAQEAADFCKAFGEWNGDPEEKHTWVPDYAVMSFLAALLGKE